MFLHSKNSLPLPPPQSSMMVTCGLKSLTILISAMTMRIQKEEQEKTADLVKEHSKQMLELLAIEQAKMRQQLQQELVRVLD